MELTAHGRIDGADQAEKEGMEVFAGGEAGGNGGGGQQVENEAVWHRGGWVGEWMGG